MNNDCTISSAVSTAVGSFLSEEMIKNNSVQLLKEARLPICSYMTCGYFGEKSTGKSTLINKISDEFIRVSKDYKYDLDNPLINNGSITHYIYVSPSIISDNTLKAQKTVDPNLHRTDVELTDPNIR